MNQPRNDSAPALSLSCPVCSARFRGCTVCSRCGSDLHALMRIAASAWRAREHCRASLRAGVDPKFLVPDSVRQIILETECYAETA